jgi:hypothetical protein
MVALIQSLVQGVTTAARRAAARIVDALPGPPSTESSPPDIDGRRQGEADLTQIKVDTERKAGRGSVR